MNMHWKLNKLFPQCRNIIWQDELYQLVSSGHVWSGVSESFFADVKNKTIIKTPVSNKLFSMSKLYFEMPNFLFLVLCFAEFVSFLDQPRIVSYKFELTKQTPEALFQKKLLTGITLLLLQIMIKGPVFDLSKLFFSKLLVLPQFSSVISNDVKEIFFGGVK